MVALNHGGRVAGDGNGFNHVRIKSALGQEFCFVRALGGGFEDFDKGLADAFSLSFRVGDSFEPPQKQP